MARYILHRLIYAAITVLVVFYMVFVLTHLVSNPVDQLLPLEATAQERANLTHLIGLDKPIWRQVVDYSKGLYKFDFGDSWWQNRPALRVVLERVPLTLELVAAAFGFAVVFAMVFGMLASLRPRGLLDKVISTVSLVGVCMPNFWVGLTLMIVFAVKLHWLPAAGVGNWKNLILPAVTLGILPLGRITQIVRSAMLDQMREQYVVTARAKGVRERTVVTKHALRNAGITIVTMAGWEAARMMAGYTVVVEVVFGWPGMGHLIMDSITRADFPLLQALTFTVAVIISLANLFIDLTYPYLDARVKYE